MGQRDFTSGAGIFRTFHEMSTTDTLVDASPCPRPMGERDRDRDLPSSAAVVRGREDTSGSPVPSPRGLQRFDGGMLPESGSFGSSDPPPERVSCEADPVSADAEAEGGSWGKAGAPVRGSAEEPGRRKGAESRASTSALVPARRL